MIWMLLRLPKMYLAIFGFQRRVWWPKWTPASSNSLTPIVVDMRLLVSNGLHRPGLRTASRGKTGLGTDVIKAAKSTRFRTFQSLLISHNKAGKAGYSN